MSTVETLLFRAISEPELARQLMADSEISLAGYRLSERDFAQSKKASRTDFAALSSECGGFRCELLQRYLFGEVDLVAALHTVQSLRSLLAEIQAHMPFGNDKHAAFRAIRLITAYVSTLDEREREQHSRFLNAVSRHLELLVREFARLEESNQESINVNRVNMIAGIV